MTQSQVSLAEQLSDPDECPATTSCPNTSETIRRVNIDIAPIFDTTQPEQDKWLFSIANALKISTGESVIARDLLFGADDLYNEKALQESERILRSRRYLFNTRIDATDNGDGTHDVDVHAREVWTTLPYLKYQRGGGSSDWSFGVHETNFLGYGKRLDLIHQQLATRTGDVLIYEDPNTGWNRTAMFLRYEDNDDGTYQHFRFTRPYFQLQTDWSGGLEVERYEQEHIAYNFGREAGRYRARVNDLDVFWGRKLDRSTVDTIERLNIGVTHCDHVFETLVGEALTSIPADWGADVVWAEYQTIQDRYIEANHIRQMSEIEDINLGLQLRARLGYSRSDFDDLNNAVYAEFEVAKNVQLNDRQYLFSELFYKGFYGDAGQQGGYLTTHASYHWNNFRRGQFYISLSGEKMFDGFADEYLLLGGKSGQRGFPAYFQTGDQRYLLSIEQRYFGETEWFSLFYLGAAIFYDQGRAWGESLVTQSNSDTLRNIGVGLRIAPTRAYKTERGTGYVLHLDLATPLKGPDNVDSLQWQVTVSHEF